MRIAGLPSVCSVLLIAWLLPSSARAQGIAGSYYHPFGGSGGPGIGIGATQPIGGPLGLDVHLSYHHLAEVMTNDPIAKTGWFSANAFIMQLGVSVGLATGPVLPYARIGLASVFNLLPTFYQGQFDRDFGAAIGAPVRGTYQFSLGSLNAAEGFYAAGGLQIPLGGGDPQRGGSREGVGAAKMFVEVKYFRMHGSFLIQGSFADSSGATQSVFRSGSVLYDGLEFRVGGGY